MTKSKDLSSSLRGIEEFYFMLAQYLKWVAFSGLVYDIIRKYHIAHPSTQGL
jgi:hypothetical protein